MCKPTVFHCQCDRCVDLQSNGWLGARRVASRHVAARADRDALLRSREDRTLWACTNPVLADAASTADQANFFLCRGHAGRSAHTLRGCWWTEVGRAHHARSRCIKRRRCMIRRCGPKRSARSAPPMGVNRRIRTDIPFKTAASAARYEAHHRRDEGDLGHPDELASSNPPSRGAGCGSAICPSQGIYRGCRAGRNAGLSAA